MSSFGMAFLSPQALLHVLASLPVPYEAKPQCCLDAESNPKAERTPVYPKILPVSIQLYRCVPFSYVNP